MQRSNREYILLAMSFGGALAILPFAINRLLNEEWLVAFVDFAMVIGMSQVGYYVYTRHETRRSAVVLALVALIGVTMVIYLKGPTTVYWAYPTMVGMYFILPPRQAIVLSGLATLILLPVLALRLEMLVFISVIITLIVNNGFAYIFAQGMHRHSNQLAEMTRVDPLTCAGNRRALDEKLNEAICCIRRVPQPVSLIFIDLDHFKTVNDTFGHAKGDQVLVSLVELVQRRIRETDSIFRLGGEEFVVLAMGAGQDVIKALAEELRVLIERTEFIKGHPVTASLGVAVHRQDEAIGQWLERADRALYHAKESGRNRVCTGEEQLDSVVINLPSRGS